MGKKKMGSAGSVAIEAVAIVIITTWVALFASSLGELVIGGVAISGSTIFVAYLFYKSWLWANAHCTSDHRQKILQIVKPWLMQSALLVIVTTWVTLAGYHWLGETATTSIVLTGIVLFFAQLECNSTLYYHAWKSGYKKSKPYYNLRKAVIQSVLIGVITIWATTSTSLYAVSVAIAIGITGIAIWIGHGIYSSWRLTTECDC